MAAGVHSDGYHFNPATASELEVVLHQAAQDAFAAASAWAATATEGIGGYGEKAGAAYRAQVVDPATRTHATLCDGLTLWAREVQAWSASNTAADQDAAATFTGGGTQPGAATQPGGATQTGGAQAGPVQTS